MGSPFDLRRFAPPAETTFTLRKHGDFVFRVDGDPEVDDVAVMLRIENVVRGIEEGNAAEALTEGKQLLLRMVRECQPDVEEIKVGPQELIILFALIVKGPTVAEAVMESITASNLAEAEALELGDDDERAAKEDDGSEGGADVAPLPSRTRSSRRSSSSPGRSSSEGTAGLPATGTG
jgi:hypothetical protein